VGRRSTDISTAIWRIVQIALENVNASCRFIKGQTNHCDLEKKYGMKKKILTGVVENALARVPARLQKSHSGYPWA
jgi:hypothetical protein